MAEQFFESKQVAALFKHAVLDSYLYPFASKTGSRSPGGRVAFVDGYAGEGRYADRLEGSPALAMRQARRLSALGRQLECTFVEQDKSTHTRLSAVVADEGEDLSVDVKCGSITDHLDDVLVRTQGIPLFLFLDPFGLAPPLEQVRKVFRRPHGPGAPATEVLINVSAVGLRRIAGLLQSDAANRRALERLDEMCGGDWWRELWLEHVPDKATASTEQREAAEEAVVEQYARKVAEKNFTNWWTFEVRNRAHHRPVYYLAFFTRHRDGLQVFGESLSLSLAKWRRAVFDVETEGTLFAGDDVFEERERALAEEWVDEIEDNLRRLLQETERFRIIQKYGEVFGTALGQAREMHLRKAWRRLYPAVTKTEPKNKLINKTIERA